jgi:hypothetical protein
MGAESGDIFIGHILGRDNVWHRLAEEEQPQITAPPETAPVHVQRVDRCASSKWTRCTSNEWTWVNSSVGSGYTSSATLWMSKTSSCPGHSLGVAGRVDFEVSFRGPGRRPCLAQTLPTLEG